MLSSRDGLTTIIWTTHKLTGPQKSILAVALLRSDGTGDIRAGTRDWARDTSLGEKTVLDTLRALDDIGVLRPVPGVAKKPVYRLDIPRLLQFHAEGSSDESHRAARNLARDRHRIQLDETEARTTLRATEERLANVERMLEDARLERKDPAQYFALLQERDRLAEDVIPRLTAFVTLYDHAAKQA